MPTRRRWLKAFGGLLAEGFGFSAYAVRPLLRLRTTAYRLVPPG